MVYFGRTDDQLMLGMTGSESLVFFSPIDQKRRLGKLCARMTRQPELGGFATASLAVENSPSHKGPRKNPY